MSEKTLKYRVRAKSIEELMSRFYPNGKINLNKTEWNGHPPHSCIVTNMRGYGSAADEETNWTFDVICRSPDHVSYDANGVKSIGWTQHIMLKSPDGLLMNAGGAPLSNGSLPQIVTNVPYGEIDFNGLDFGTLIGTRETPGITHTTLEPMVEEIRSTSRFDSGITRSRFIAARRNRPFTKIIITSMKSGVGVDHFGNRMININTNTQHFEIILMDQLFRMLMDFIEGRISLHVKATGDAYAFVQLDQSVVDCTPNEVGMDSWFYALTQYTPVTNAIRLSVTRAVFCL
jgi:hypothetical protein